MSKKTTRRNSDLKPVQKSNLTEEVEKKLFLLKEPLNESNLTFYSLRHPGTERKSYFHYCSSTKQFFHLIQFKEPNRCFFIDQCLCSNGTFYITIPFDITFLFLYYIRKNCMSKAIPIDHIQDDDYPELLKFLTEFGKEELLEKISDVKKSQDNSYFMYNNTKTLAWLAIKIKRVAEKLFNNKAVLLVKNGSISSNYTKSETLHQTNIEEYLQQACDIVGTFITKDLRSEVLAYFSISTTNMAKRKLDKINEKNTKKFKSEKTSNGSPAILSPPIQATKKKTPGAKELKLAKAATGSKSIASFFKK